MKLASTVAPGMDGLERVTVTELLRKRKHPHNEKYRLLLKVDRVVTSQYRCVAIAPRWLDRRFSHWYRHWDLEFIVSDHVNSGSPLRGNRIFLNTDIYPDSASFIPFELSQEGFWSTPEERRDFNSFKAHVEKDDLWLEVIVQWTNYKKRLYIVDTIMNPDILFS